MDLFGKKKIRTLENDVKFWKIKYETLSQEMEKEIERLKAVIRGDRVCDGYCQKCKHGILVKDNLIGLPVKYTCALDCKCKDFQKAETDDSISREKAISLLSNFEIGTNGEALNPGIDYARNIIENMEGTE